MGVDPVAPVPPSSTIITVTETHIPCLLSTVGGAPVNQEGQQMSAVVTTRLITKVLESA